MATDEESLRRHWRRLLRAYPDWYRRERGLELLTTLLDAAPAGQRRPGRRDVLDVWWAALRCRLRPPPGAGYVLVTVIVALSAGLVGAGLAGHVGMATLAAPPTEDEAVALAEAATGERPRNTPGPIVRCEHWCPEDHWRPTGDQVVLLDLPIDRNHGVDQVTVAYWWTPSTITERATTTRARLAAAGWAIVDEPRSSSLRPPTFTAERDGVSLTLQSANAGAGHPTMLLLVDRNPPPLPIAVIVGTGLASGLVVGWLVAAWLLQRFTRHRLAVRTTTLLLGLPALLVLTLLDGASLSLLSVSLLDGRPAALVPAIALSLATHAWVPILVVVLLLAALGTLPLPAHRPPTSAKPPAPTR